MRKFAQVRVGAAVLPAVIALLAASAGPGRSGGLPAQATYLVYFQGQPAGKSVIKTVASKGAVVFESTSEIQFEDYSQKLRCRTEADPKTFASRRFEYEGEIMGRKVSGSIWVAGDTIHGDLYDDGAYFPSRKQVPAPLMLFQHYIVEHQIAIFNAVAHSGGSALPFFLFFARDFTGVASTIALESELEVEETTPPVVCRKYQVNIQNGAPYTGYFDLKRGLPVYLDFPAATTEFFLESAYKGEPPAKYTKPAAAAGN